jgi:hypothetical protein
MFVLADCPTGMEPNATVLVDAESVPVAVGLFDPRFDKLDVQPFRNRPPRSAANNAASRNRISQTLALKSRQSELQKPAVVIMYDYLCATIIMA